MILITNPTGRIGRIIADMLIASGQPTRVLARDPQKLSKNVRQEADIALGSHRDASTLANALAGVDRVFWCIPQDHQAENILDYYLDFARAFVEALKTSSVTHVVGISSGGKGRAKAAGPISALHAVEDMIDASGITTRFLRCGSFMENLLWQIEPMKRHGIIGYPVDGDKAMPIVAVKDIAAVAVKWLLAKEWSGQDGVAVYGPTDLSFRQVTAILSQALNKPIAFRQTPDAVYQGILEKSGCSPAFAQGLVDMFHAIGHDIYEAETRTPENATPTTLRDWAQGVLKPVMDA